MLVIFDKQTRTEGVKEYLENGAIGDRNEKDKRVALLGNLELIDKIATLGREKGYKEAYRNIVLSFEEDDISTEKLEQIANDFIKMYMHPYNPDEYNTYAEAHIPKRKINSRGYERKKHIHIVIPTYSLKLKHQLDLGNHRKRLKEIELIKEFLETKYNLKSVEQRKIIKEDKAEIFDIAKYQSRNKAKKGIENYIKDNIQHYDKLDDLISDLSKKLNAKIKTSKNAKTPYISIKLPNFQRAIRLKGELFNPKTFTQAKQNLLKNSKYIEVKQTKRSLNEILKDLEQARAKRVEYILKRIKNKRLQPEQQLKKIQQSQKVKNYISYQEKILSRIYNYDFKELLKGKGFFVRKYDNTGYTLISNKKKDIKVLDKGNKIVAKGGNLEEQARIMVELAVAKGWDLKNVRVSGSEEFKKIATELIQQKIKELELQQEQSFSLTFANANVLKTKREKKEEKQQPQPQPTPAPQPEPEPEPIHDPQPQPSSYIKSKLREARDNQQVKELDLKTLKEVLTAENLLKFLKSKELLEKDYEIVNNKFKVGRKRLNIVDFCLKELNLSFKETSKLLNQAYNINLNDLKGENMQDKKIDWKQIKKELHPLTIAEYYGFDIKPEQISKKNDEYRIKVGNRNYNVVDYLLKEQGFKFKDITENIDNLMKLQRELQLKKIDELDKKVQLSDDAKKLIKEKAEQEKREQIKIIENAKREDLSIYLANLGYNVDKKKSSRNYRVMENDEGDKVIVYKKGDKYLYFNPLNDNDKGDIYNFFANRGIKSYKQIVDIIKGANKNIDLKPLEVAKKPYQIDKALEEWNAYYKDKTDNDYSYLTDKRLIDESIIKAYAHSIKSDKYGNIVVPLYLKNLKFGMVGFDRRLKERTEDQPKSYINGRKGLAILQPKNFKNVENVVICENYIDGLSYLELSKLDPSKTAIVSTQGTLNKDEKESIKEYLKMATKHAKLDKVLLAMDNDEAGKRMSEDLQKMLKNDYKVHNVTDMLLTKIYKTKDFNEALIKSKTWKMTKDKTMYEKYKHALSNDEIKKAWELAKKEREEMEKQKAKEEKEIQEIIKQKGYGYER